MREQALAGEQRHRSPRRELTVLVTAPSGVVDRIAGLVRSEIEQVYTASSIADAVARVETTSIDCIVSDLELNDGGVISLLQAIQTGSPVLGPKSQADGTHSRGVGMDSSEGRGRPGADPPPVVVWTADGSEAAASEVVGAGVTDYVPRRDDDVVDSAVIAGRIRQAVNREGGDARVTDHQLVRDLHDRLSKAETIDAGLHTVLTDVCESTDWAYGELWVPNSGRDKLVHAKSYTLDERYEEFVDITRTTTFQKGEGLPGRVWATRDSEWIHDVSELPPDRYIRTEVAERSDFKAAFGVPVRANGRVEAVLAYYLTERRQPDDCLRTIVEPIAAGFGRLVAVKQLESEAQSIEIGPDAGDVHDWHRAAGLDVFADHPDTSTWFSTVDPFEIVHTGPDLDAVLGHPADRIRGDPGRVLAIVHPDDRDHVQRVWENRRDAYSIEYRMRTDDGDVHWIEERGSPLEGEGDPEYFLSVVEDVTDRKARETAGELARTFVERSPDECYVIEPDTASLLEVNETASRNLGYEREALLSMSFLDVVPELTDGRWERIEGSIRGHGSETVETVHRREDGSTYPVELRLTHVPVRRGSDRIVAIGRDRTEREERETILEGVRTRYRTLLAASPHPIVVSDAESGEIVDANEATARLSGRQREELIGGHRTELHPEDDRDRYRDLYGRAAREELTVSQFPDGTSLSLISADGNRVPVSASFETVSTHDRTLVYGIFRDVSAYAQFEETVATVRTVATDLGRVETPSEVARLLVDAVGEVLDLPEAVAYRYDDRAGVLLPEAATDELAVDELSPVSPGESVVWRAFVDEGTRYPSETGAADATLPAAAGRHGQLVVPLGSHGAVVVGERDRRGYDDYAIEFVELLCTVAEDALTRIERTETLQDRDAESIRQGRRLEHVERLTDVLRSVVDAVIGTRSREGISRSLCASLLSLDHVDCAWIAAPNPETDELRVTAEAGAPEPYLESLPLYLGTDSRLPAVRAMREREPVTEDAVASELQTEKWRQTALLYEFRSITSVPLVHDDVLYGVLTVEGAESNQTDETTLSVLSQLGALVGYAYAMADRRDALLEDETVALTFDITGATDVFVDLARHFETEVRLENVSARAEKGYLVHFTVETDDPDSIVTYLTDSPTVRTARVISDGGEPLIEAMIVGECIPTTVASLGANVHGVTVSDSSCRVHLSIPQDRDRGTFINHLEERYPEVELTAYRGSSTPSPSPDLTLDRQLSVRQREILNAAYYGGFFEQPRKSTGKEIAESLGISQPAFSKQLRLIQKKLLESRYDRFS